MEANGNGNLAGGGIPLPHLPLFLGANAVDENGNVIPEAQIIRREVIQGVACSQRAKAKLTVLFCVVQTVMSSMFAWIYLASTHASAPKTFSWKHLNQFFYVSVTNSSEGCLKFSKSLPVHRDSGIRPFLNSNDFCVIDKTTTICPFAVLNDYWLSVPLVPLLTFCLPILMLILTILYVFGSQNMRRDSLGKLLCPMYIICVTNPLIFLFGWTKQFLQLVIGEGVKTEMLFGYNLMIPPYDISTQWQITQMHSECCGFHSYMDWNVSGPDARYPLSCCNTKVHSCDIPPTKEQVWKKGCYAEERNGFTFTTGITVLLLLFKSIIECVFFLLVVDTSPVDMQETSMIHCRDFTARAFGSMEITDVVTDNRIIVRVHNFRANLHMPFVERTYRYVELYIRSRGVTHGSVHIMPTNGMTLEDIIVNQELSHRGIFEITTITENAVIAE